MKYSYEISRNSAEGIDGWRLRLLENSAMVSEVTFKIGDATINVNDALDAAYRDAQLEAKEWVKRENITELHHSSPFLVLGLAAVPLLLATLFLLLLMPTVLNVVGEILHAR